MWKIEKYQILSRLISFFIFFNTSFLEAKEPHFVFFTGSYNNVRWVERFISSLAMQQYKDWECIYVNDASTDATGELVEQFALQYAIRDKMKIVHNSFRRKLVANMFTQLHQIDPKSIVVIVDGDDFLAHSRVLNTLKKYYMDPNVWTTYGDCTSSPKSKNFVSLSKKIPSAILKKNRIRYQPWMTDHLRTFYAELFQRIRKEDLQENGHFFEIIGDVATMFPIIEMSSRGHVRYIRKILLRYNVENSLSDRFYPEEMKRVSQLIVGRKRYKPIKGQLFPE